MISSHDMNTKCDTFRLSDSLFTSEILHCIQGMVNGTKAHVHHRHKLEHHGWSPNVPKLLERDG